MLMRLLSPGCAVMMRLGLKAKMGLLAAGLLLPLLVPVVLVVQDLTSPGSPVAQGRWVLTLGGLLVSGLILLYFATAFVVDFKSRLQVLIDTMTAYAEGDLVPRAQLQGRDELSALGHTAERVAEKLSEIARGVGNLDALTRQNQQMVGDSTLSALELMDRAGRLANDVSAIRLRQGSADEARNLVDRAMSLIQRQGLAAAIAQMRQPGSGFVDRDLYVFITDAQGVYRLHTGNPVMEGRRVHEAPGIDGDRFVRESLAEAHGSHWVDYTITNPLSGLPQSKTSYVLPLEGDLVLGCGFYRHQLQQEQSSLGVTFM